MEAVEQDLKSRRWFSEWGTRDWWEDKRAHTAAGGLNGGEGGHQSHKRVEAFKIGMNSGQFVVIQPVSSWASFQGNCLGWDVGEVTNWQSYS